PQLSVPRVVAGEPAGKKPFGWATGSAPPAPARPAAPAAAVVPAKPARPALDLDDADDDRPRASRPAPRREEVTGRPRPRRSDDEDEYEHDRPRRRGGNTGMLVALVG